MDSVRKLIEQRADELGFNLKQLSLDLGLNDAYFHQFVRYGKPKKGLPEVVRNALAEKLKLDPSLLGAPPTSLRVATPSVDETLFRIDERDVEGSAGTTGYASGAQFMELSPNGDGLVERPASRQSFYFPEEYARTVLGLHVGKADILPVRGDSMDDGSKYALVDGDRVIIDLSAKDIRQGAIFAVWDGAGVIIKQIEIMRGSKPAKLLCTSLNPRYKPFELDINEDVHVIGRVVAKLARM
jgi:hypothetical protein